MIDPVSYAQASDAGFVAELMTRDGLMTVFRSGLIVFFGFPVVVGISRWIRRTITARQTPQRGLIAGKLVYYPGLVVILGLVMTELGFSLAPLLGAAGIVGIALGFASQTSVSNVISGFFLIGEQPFVVDDVLQVGDITGRVLSVDMLSVKLCTFDNRFVRIPNETIVKTHVINLTRFPIRRLDINVGVAYGEDIARVSELLLGVAEKNPLALMEPQPLVIFQGFGDSSLNMLFAVWTTRENFLALRNSVYAELKIALDEARIEIPFPHRTLYAGSKSDPIRLELVTGSQVASDGIGLGPGESPMEPSNPTEP